MKRLLAYLFIVLGFGLMFNVSAEAGIITYEPKANQIILINSNTNQILYEKNSNQKINPGSFTKIMTSIIVFDAIKKGQISLKDKLPVSEKAWKISASGYSSMFIMVGDQISVENLLRGLIVVSGNDAAIVLAEGLAGSENNFVKLMNDKAKEIGLNYTKFGNSTGIIIPTNTTTVKDVAIMSSYLINNYPELYYFFGEKQFTWNRTGGDPITQGNRNPLLYKNMNVDGLKTSYNQTDRYGLASSMYLKNNDDRLIVVGSGFKDKNDRSRESAKLLTFGKTNYHTFKIAKKEPSQTQEIASNNKKTNNRKSILREYDLFLSKKYPVEINQKDIDGLKNYIKRGDLSINNQDIIVKIDKTNVTTQNFIDHVNQKGISLVSIKNNLDKNIVEEIISGLISSKLIDFEIKEHNLSIDDRKLVKIIKENKIFHDENGVFQRSKYKKFLLSNNITAVEFEEKLKKQELRKLLFDSVVAGTLRPKKKVKVAKKAISKEIIPVWFLNIPNTTDKIIYARGTAVSKNSKSSKNEALINALIDPARKLKNTITQKEAGIGTDLIVKTEIKSGNYKTVCIGEITKPENCKDNRDIFNWNSLSDYTIVKEETQELANGDFRSFVLLEYSVDKAWKEYAKLLNLKKSKTKESKKKIAKKPKEEFKPEKVNQDNIKPIIDIKSEYTFKDAAYTFKGKVKDKGGSEKLYLFSKKGDSKRKQVTTDKKGKFEITGFSLESEEITLIAIDSSNNETEKIVKVIIDIEEETEIAKVYEQLKPIKKGKKDNNRVAIIIGVESYEKSSKALYADNDAKMFKYFATKALGISSANIKLLVDNEAKRLDTIEALKGWLPRKILKDKSELFVFFSGHGYPSNDDGLYLIPQNGDPRFLEESALSKNYIIEQIQKLQPKSVTMFFDACYSGNGKDGEVLVAGLKPIRKLEIKEEIPENFYIFSSSDYNQESSTIKEAEHGIFSYYLMKGLEGNADQNKDKKITNGELIAYLKDNVSQEAFTQNREQDPMLAGDPDKILMSYR